MNQAYRDFRKNPSSKQWDLINDLVKRISKKANHFRTTVKTDTGVLYITGTYAYKKNGKSYYDDTIKVLTRKTSGGKTWQTKLKAILATLIENEPRLDYIDFVITGYKDNVKHYQLIQFDPKRTGTMRSLKAYPVEKD